MPGRHQLNRRMPEAWRQQAQCSFGVKARACMPLVISEGLTAGQVGTDGMPGIAPVLTGSRIDLHCRRRKHELVNAGSIDILLAS